MSNQRLIAAQRRVRSELASYDLLSRRSVGLVRTHEHEYHSSDADQYGPEKGYVCGHKVSLCSPCDKCCRLMEDCVEYQKALTSKLSGLLSKLKG